MSDLGGSPGPFGSPVVPLVGVSSKDQPGAERRHFGQLRGRLLLEDTGFTYFIPIPPAQLCLRVRFLSF